VRTVCLVLAVISATAFAQRKSPAPARPWAETKVVKSERALELARAGREALEQNQPMRAIQQLTECTNLDPDSYQCAISLGLAYMQVRDRPAARYWLDRGSRLRHVH
jgi:Flp pilus assembly protein TadD